MSEAQLLSVESTKVSNLHSLLVLEKAWTIVLGFVVGITLCDFIGGVFPPLSQMAASASFEGLLVLYLLIVFMARRRGISLDELRKMTKARVHVLFISTGLAGSIMFWVATINFLPRM